MVNLPARKVGIISCSGEDLAEGTVSRMATRLVLEKLRPGQTVTLCLPLFLAGGKEERTFARFYPTIAVDGCGKLCAAKATEAYSARPAAVVVVSDVARRFSHLKAESRRHLGEGGMELARQVAEAVVARVDEILVRPPRTGVFSLDTSGGEQVVRLDAPPSPRQTQSGGCTCGQDRLPVKTILVSGGPVGIAGLEQIFEQLLASSSGQPDGELKKELLRQVKIYNYVAPGSEDGYRDALWSKFAAYRGKRDPSR